MTFYYYYLNTLLYSVEDRNVYAPTFMLFLFNL